MKVNAIVPNYVGNVRRNRLGNEPISNPNEQPSKLTAISFKGGNPDQAILYVAETKPYYQKGGVATVMQDLRALRVSEKSPTMDEAYKKSFDFWVPSDKVIVDSVYNGQKVYNETTGLLEAIQVAKIPNDLPKESPFSKYAGEYFMTNNPNFQNYINASEFFKAEEKTVAATGKPNLSINNNVFILKDVTGVDKKMMDFGGTGETEIKLFRVFREDGGKLKATNDFKIFSDVPASWKAPYGEGGYATNAGSLSQTWKGDGDARAAKAFTELMERICEVKSADGVKFDPATVMLNDSQAAYATEYMAQKAAKGGEFWKGKKPTMVGHNLAEGYVQRTSYMNMFVNIADKELRNAVSEDPKYIEALKEGGDAVEAYFEKLLPKEIKDAQGKVSPFMNTIYYAKQGYVPMISTVSDDYWKKIVTDPNFIPGYHADLKELSDKGRFRGILNAFENVGMSPYTGGVGGYYNEYVFPEEAGEMKGRKISKFQVFDPAKVNESSVDINHVREIKRQNKISLLERFDKEVLESLEKLKTVENHETAMSTVIAGLPDKKVEVYGHIDNKYLEALKKGEDVKVITSWGRGDTQKALDTVLESFAMYVEKNGAKDPNTVLVMGGALEGYPDGKAIKNLIEKYNNMPELKGRFVYLDGFAPNKPLASAADFAMFPSRFAPCELTDLEAMKVFCSPIVTDCQGLAQKNFDPMRSHEAGKATGYKTTHEFSVTFEEMKRILSKEDAAKMEADVAKFKQKIQNGYRLTHNGKTLSELQLNNMIQKDASLDYIYKYEVLRPYKDKVIATELSDCLERALITDRNSEIQTQMVQNHLKQYTDWERNNALNPSNKSSAQLYREYHFQNDKSVAVKEEDTLLAKLRNNCKDILEEYRTRLEKAGKEVADDAKKAGDDAGKAAKESGGSMKKVLGIGAAVVAGVAAGYYYFNNKKKPEAEGKNLSCSV